MSTSLSEGKSLWSEAVPEELPNCDGFGATSSKPGFSVPVRQANPLFFLVFLFVSFYSWFFFFLFCCLQCGLTLFLSTGLKLVMPDQTGLELIETYLPFLLGCKEQRRAPPHLALTSFS